MCGADSEFLTLAPVLAEYPRREMILYSSQRNGLVATLGWGVRAVGEGSRDAGDETLDVVDVATGNATRW